ncbi:MAG: beta-propeller fold lactonase family protein [Caldilineales bacterium]|nr:beta-propeller fold lactonase family protein [Caldilineales bacterium]
MNRKELILTSLLALLIFVLAACSNQSAIAPEQPAQSESQQSQVDKSALQSDDQSEKPAIAAEKSEEPQWTIWVANGIDDNLSVVDLSSGVELARLPAGINPHILAASPDGSVVYVINAGQHDRDPNAHADMSASEDSNGAASAEGEMSGMHEAEASPDMLMAIDNDVEANSLWALEAATGNVLARVPVGGGPTHPIPSPDGQRVYVTNTDEGSVTVIDTNTWEVIAAIPDLAEPHDGALSLDGKWLYLATSADSTMTMVDTETFEISNKVSVGTRPRGLAAGGEQGELVYVTNKGDGTLSKIDAPSGEVIYTAPVGAGAHAVRLSPDGSRAYIALSKADAVAIVDAATGDVLGTIAVGKIPEQLDISADGGWLLVSNNGDATISVIDLAQETVTRTIPVGQGAYGIQTTWITLTPTISSLPDLAPNSDGFVDINVQQLQTALSQKDFTLVNVHVPYAGEIPDTDLFIPYDLIQSQFDALPNQDSPIVVYCRSGSMSTMAATVLARLGYSNVFELDGGFNAWQAVGNELIVN